MSSDIREAFTYRFKRKTNERVSGSRCCQNCKWWITKWYKDKENCSDLGYYSTCNDFEYQVITRVEEEIITTYKQIDPETVIFGRGNLEKIEKYFGNFDIIDQRSAPPLGYELKCTAALYPEQQRVCDEWYNAGGGFMKSPTGSGKSVMLCWLIAKLGLKTIILSQETRHLQVIIDALYAHTNLKELEEENGIHIIGKVGEEYCNKKNRNYVRKNREIIYPLSLSTYQNFYRQSGQETLQRIKNEFGFLWIEEAHHEAAETFHNVVRNFNTHYRGGGSATPLRERDKLHVVIYDTIGDITARGFTEQMEPKCTFIETDVVVPKWVFQKMYPVSSLLSFLGSSDEYRQIVLSYFLKDIEDGRIPLLISERRNFAMYIQEQVKMSGYASQLIMGGMKLTSQEECINKMIEGKLNCIIGTKVLKENINLTPLNALHLPFPTFQRGTEEQTLGRIRRYLKDKNGNPLPKPQPLVRIFTYKADHKIPESAMNFRRSLYKSWGFEVDYINLDREETTEPVKRERCRGKEI